eukprot:m.106383 g.106383  ORF g.106383 m.106383 type:complete len:100 (+) comp37260_c0_seq1:184-483(+)
MKRRIRRHDQCIFVVVVIVGFFVVTFNYREQVAYFILTQDSCMSYLFRFRRYLDRLLTEPEPILPSHSQCLALKEHFPAVPSPPRRRRRRFRLLLLPLL